TENQGLKRAYTLTIEAKEIEARIEQEVRRLAPQVRMPGFRPGKVPANLIKKMHGDSLQSEALNSAVQEGVQKLLTEQKVRPALQPQVELADGYAPGKDAEVKVSLEALPDVPAPVIEGLKLERLTVEPDESQVDEQLKRLASSNKAWTDAPKGHKAATGDLVVMDFVGTVDGEKFEGGSGEGMQVELGSGQLIPGFEEGLEGVKVGESRDVAVTFPEEYHSEKVKGKPANFAIKVTAVKVAGENKVDEEFAKNLGLESLDKLREILRDQQTQELNGLTRTHMKRRLLDQLAASHSFPVPESMVEAEFGNIMQQLQHEASHEEDPEAARAELEKDAGEYRTIAERRVRLGLLLSEIGAANGVDITQQEMSRLIMQAASQYQPKDRERFIEYVQKDPMAAAQLRAPLYEDKVVDFLFSKAEITDRAASRAELEADLESEEGHVHGPGCGHDHAHDAKPAKAAKSKKAKADAPAEAAPAEAKTKPAPKKVKLTEEATAEPKPAKPLKSEPANKAQAKEAGEKKAPAKKAAAKK
ncbi:MAG: trigger factor, partial [Sphingomicrobium sp.]